MAGEIGAEFQPEEDESHEGRRPEISEPILYPSLRAKRSNPGPQYDRLGLAGAAHAVAPGLLRRKGSSQ